MHISKIALGFLGLILTLILAVLLGEWIFEKTYQFPKPEYGVTFSPRYARYLGLDWQKTYLQILDELKVKNLRLPSYWNSLAPEEEKYDFSDTDFMLDEAAKRGVRVTLVLGVKQPRWPECYIPAWAKNLTVGHRQQEILQFMEQVVKRYQGTATIWAWQIENEPFLPFGEGCDKYDENFLQSELELVRELDSRPLILTDSGELGVWVMPMQLSDILGVSVYRTTYNPVLGYQTYPLTPFLYNLKSSLVRRFFARANLKTIIAELQAEPWLSRQDSNENTPQSQKRLFSEEDLKNNVIFAKRVGFDEIYLWGVEWWYWMDKQGYPEYLDYAKTLFD